MKLPDLDPRWLVHNGERVGFIFKSPTNPKWWQTCFSRSIRTMFCDECRAAGLDRSDEGICDHSQLGLAKAAGVDADTVQPCNYEACWSITGTDFGDLTVTPSLDGSAGGLWHGHITNGDIVGGV